MSTPNSTLRHRGPKDKQKANGDVKQDDTALDKVLESSKQAVTSEWDYKLALAIITGLAFVTRFFGISHPNEVVFDEVHFGKVSLCPNRMRTASELRSLHHTISSERTSSMFTHRSLNSSLLSLDGSLATTATSNSRTSAIPISPIMFHTWLTDPCLRCSAPSPCQSSSLSCGSLAILYQLAFLPQV